MITKDKIKGYFTKQNIALAIACLVLFFQVGMYFFSGNDHSLADLLVKRDIDNLKSADASRAKELAGIREQRANDSVQLESIKSTVENVPNVINQITSKYEKDRRNLANSSIDSRLQFFTNSFSKEGDSSNGGNGD